MQKWLFPLLAAALLAALFFVMRPEPAPVPAALPTSSTSSTPSPTTVPAASALPTEQLFELVVKDKQLLSGPVVLAVSQGSTVRLRVTVDAPDELHLHGYDLSLHLQADQPGELRFVADKSGRFEYELHHAHLELGALEVQPQ